MAERSWLHAASDEEWSCLRKAALLEGVKGFMNEEATRAMVFDRRLLEKSLDAQLSARRKLVNPEVTVRMMSTECHSWVTCKVLRSIIQRFRG